MCLERPDAETSSHSTTGFDGSTFMVLLLLVITSGIGMSLHVLVGLPEVAWVVVSIILFLGLYKGGQAVSKRLDDQCQHGDGHT